MITEDAKKKVALFLKEFYTQANVGVGGGIFGELPQDDQFDEMRLEGVQISGTAATDGTEATVETIMLGRVNFDGVSSLSASDEIEFVYTVEVE